MRYVTIGEVKEILEKEAEHRALSQEQKYALAHAQTFAKLDAKSAKKLMEELMRGDLLDELAAVKVADIMPQSTEELRAILGKERMVEQKVIEQVLEIISRYVQG
ncbi:MAG: RNA polymerase Rpb4 family protein [Candidatus Thermoplasmatota archaeon]